MLYSKEFVWSLPQIPGLEMSKPLECLCYSRWGLCDHT